MQLLPRWLGSQKPAHEAELEQQVTRLQATLVRCRNAAGFWGRLRPPFKAAIVVLTLAAGFVLGAYSGPLRQAALDLRAGWGFGGRDDASAAFAAYQQQKYAAALDLARPLAEAGDARARTLLGLVHLNGRGVPKDLAQAARWFRLAAEQGDTQAQFNLGNMHSEGQGVPQDYGEAVKWYRRAADQGDPQAQYNLGLWYATGEGGAYDTVGAHMWFNLAATRFPASDARNRETAIKNRDLVAKQMTREQIDEAQRLAREWKPN